MKAKLKKLTNSANQSFGLQLSRHYHAYNELHYHSEIELIYIIEGQGVLLIGDKIEPVKTGDVLMIGSNLPHLFRFDTFTFEHPLFKQGRVELPVELLTLHFNPDIFGNQFIALPENEYLQTVIRNSAGSPAFFGELRDSVIEMLYQLLNAGPYQRMMLLMQLLALIADGKAYQPLNTDMHPATFNPTDETRLTKIYLYTLNNFQRTITLKEIAATIYMCPNAFCRYFKSRTHKSYFDFLLEVRINHARKLLKETAYSIVVVGYESGFPNLSNFNRYFKAITGKTPLATRKEFQKYF
ncbi:MAG: AraC family transcriptional regulator [Bacteroidota bacterium]